MINLIQLIAFFHSIRYHPGVNSQIAVHAPKASFYHPEKNLPGRNPHRITKEDRFTLNFIRSYRAQYLAIHHRSPKTKHVFIRQMAINGFGIADLVYISWPPDKNKRTYDSIEDFLLNSRPTIRAFEIKLDNWRKGLIQTNRYKYYANTSILVLPNNRCFSALSYIATFHKIHVGLWGFDDITKRVFPYYTPRPSSAIESKYRLKALEIALSTSKFLPIREKL
jgi:hypothetical protein